MFNRQKERYLTLTFDDGFWNGAQKIDGILEPCRATFYIVTGWVKPNAVPIQDKYNLGADHGTAEDWRALSQKGHDIGSHSHSHHKNARPEDYQQSLEFLRQIHNGPYSLAFPYNQPVPIAVAFDTIRVGSGKLIYNTLATVDLKRIYSWSPWPASLPMWRILWKIGRLPDRSWLVLNLHSLDGEGWHPWTSTQLSRLKNFALDKNFHIKTMAEMAAIIKDRKQA